MKRKDYDDDLLVEMIARGEMPHAEIGRRVGLDRSTVRRIAGGRNRPDLQEKINTRIRTCLAERRGGLRQSGETAGAAAARPCARKKDYDDDLLVELIARGEMSYAEIAGRIGVERSMVGMIARGQNRPDLQEKINTRMRSCLADKRRRASPSPGRFDKLPSTALRVYDKASETGGPGPGGRKKEYNDELLVELIARGDMSRARIAERVGLSPSMVGKIARGESRRDLRPRILAMGRGIQEEAHRLGARWLRGLLTRHIRDGLEGTGEFARRCRKDLIDKLFDPEILKRIAEPPPPEESEPIRGLSDLSTGLQKQILDELGVHYDDSWTVDQTAEGQEPIESVI